LVKSPFSQSALFGFMAWPSSFEVFHFIDSRVSSLVVSAPPGIQICCSALAAAQQTGCSF
jgi:hypothetical protein